MLALSPLLLSTVGHATQVTEMPARLGVIGGFEYSGSSLQGDLVEAGREVAQRRVSRHDLDLQAAFAPAEGVAFTLEIAITPSMRLSYPDARTMIVEPLDGSGSYLSGDTVADSPAVKASGLQGLWLGVALAPFSQRYLKNQGSTWRLDAAFRTPSPNRNLWTAPNGTRGAAPGGTALRLVGAFSTDRGVAEPWLRGELVKENPVNVEVVDEEGVTWARELAVQPASTFDITGGVAVVGYSQSETSTEVAVDLFLGAQYRTWEDVASGVYLPNVLDGARSIPVTAGDSIAARTGFAVDLQVNEYIQVRSGLEFTYRTPFRLEHVYPVSTSADSWQIGWSFQFQGLGDFQPVQ